MSLNGTLGNNYITNNVAHHDVDQAVTVTTKKWKPNVTNSTSTSTMEDASSNKKQREHKVKDLPSELSLLDDKDCEKFVLILEAENNPKSQFYKKKFLVAQSVRILESEEHPDGKFDLNKLTIEQMRKSCKNVGISNCGSQNKFNSRKASGTYFQYQEMLQKNGMKPSTHSARVTSTYCRTIKVVFSDEFIEDFKTVNDR
jgi:hypothetical protein